MSDLYLEMPKEIRVGFYTFEIKTIKAELANAKNVYGYVEFAENTISVSEDLNDQQLLNTVFHEVIHAVHWNHNLHDKSSEEEFTLLTANGLCAFYVDNPEFVSWFFGLKEVTEVKKAKKGKQK